MSSSRAPARYLKHDSLAAYCDFVLMPALRLAVFDLERGTISRDQQLKVRETIVAVIAAHRRRAAQFHTAPRHAMSVLDQIKRRVGSYASSASS